VEVHIRPAREADVLDIAQIYVDAWRTAYAGFVPADYLNAMDYDEEARGVLDFAFDSGKSVTLQVAVADRRVVGYISAGPNTDKPTNYEAEIYELFILKEYQGLGIGKKLMLKAAQWIDAEGFSSVLVWCWEQNPNRVFYEKLGGRLIHSAMQTVGKASLNAIVFGWELDKLVESLNSNQD